MSRRAIAIGIRKYSALAELPGAVVGAREFVAWATSAGYESRLLVDDQGPVKLDQVYKAVEEALLTEPERLLIFFAGHGASAGQGDFWLLSDWDRDPNQVINLGFSITHAKRHPVTQIALFADACRTPTSEAAYLLGTTMFPSRQKHPKSLPQIDLFQSTRLGEIAQEVRPKEGEPFGVFTKILLRALRCQEIGATDDRDGRPHVTSQALKKWLDEALPLESGKLPGGVTQMPESQASWQPIDNFYAVWPTPPQLPETRPVARSRNLRFNSLGRETARAAVRRKGEALDTLMDHVNRLMTLSRPASKESHRPIEFEALGYSTYPVIAREEKPGVLMLEPTRAKGLAAIRVGEGEVLFNTYSYLSVRLIFDHDRMLAIQYVPARRLPNNRLRMTGEPGQVPYARLVAKAWLGERLTPEEVAAIRLQYRTGRPGDPATEALLSYHLASLVDIDRLPWSVDATSSLDALLTWPTDRAPETHRHIPHLTRSWAYVHDFEGFEELHDLRPGLVNSLWSTFRADFQPKLRRLVEGAR